MCNSIPGDEPGSRNHPGKRKYCSDIRGIDADPTATRLVIGLGAIETTFYTHVPALDDIGATPVSQKLAVDHPGWVVTFSDIVALLTRPGVEQNYRFIQQGSYPVFDQVHRSHLLLFRIQPLQDHEAMERRP